MQSSWTIRVDFSRGRRSHQTSGDNLAKTLIVAAKALIEYGVQLNVVADRAWIT